MKTQIFTTLIAMVLPLAFIFSQLPVDLKPPTDGSRETARLQVIHNSADLAAATVDVFVNGNPFIEDFDFRTATPFENVPAGVELSIDVAPAGAGIGSSVGTFDFTLAADQTYVLVATGIVSQSGYQPSIAFNLIPFAGAREEATTITNTDVLVFHGATDAPEVSVWSLSTKSVENPSDINFERDSELFSFAYGDFQDYLELPTSDYVLEIRAGGNPVVAFSAPLETYNLEGDAITVLASGFLNPANNSNGPAFGLFVALATGGDLIALPVYQEEPATVVDIILGSEDHTTLAAAVAAAELVEALQGEGPFTVFAPTNAAFDALPEGLLDDLLADPSGLLTDILLYHVVNAYALSTDLEDGQMITTLLDADVTVTISNGNVFINDAKVIVADLIAENGVVHVIDAVLVPQEDPTNVLDFQIREPEIKLFPNPVSTNLSIEIELSQNSDLTIDIYNILGVKVDNIYTSSNASEFNRIQYNVSGLQTGMYIVTVTSGQTRTAKRLQVTRN